MFRTITREEAARLGHMAWFVWVDSKIVYRTNVAARS
jgi:hypothetical protein